jgi:hypothetical protein
MMPVPDVSKPPASRPIAAVAALSMLAWLGLVAACGTSPGPDRPQPPPTLSDLVSALDPAPYQATPRAGSQAPAPPSPSAGDANGTRPAITLPCVRGMGLDSDGDGRPDHCDPIYDWKDSDDDGLYDKDDTAPYHADRDNDGQPDGWDRDPNESSYVEERRRRAEEDARRRQQQREQEARDERRRQAEREERRRQEREDERRRLYP